VQEKRHILSSTEVPVFLHQKRKKKKKKRESARNKENETLSVAERCKFTSERYKSFSVDYIHMPPASTDLIHRYIIIIIMTIYVYIYIVQDGSA
jgi:predicted DNA repair protein MutK